MKSSRFPARSWLKAALALICVLAPLSLLFALRGGFYIDWATHLWLVAYFGRFMTEHHRIPLAINSPRVVGMMLPIFYGYLFYPIIGAVSAALGPNLAIRLALGAVWAWQFQAIRSTSKKLGLDSGAAWLLACSFAWGTYALTNLYNRSALPEFVAGSLLAISLCLFIDFLRATDRRQAWRLAGRFGFAFTLCAGAHPITAVFSVPFLVVVGIAWVLSPGQRRINRVQCGALAVAAFASFAILLPWVAAVARFNGKLFINVTFHDVVAFKDSIDGNLNRFALFPTDSRVIDGKLDGVSTPYLDGQICTPLLLFVIYLVGRVWPVGSRKRGTQSVGSPLLLAVGAAAFLFSTWLSLATRVYVYLPAIFSNVQFVYRLITFQNLSLLVMVFGIRAWRPVSLESVSRKPDYRVVLGLLFSLSAIGLGIKLAHGLAVRGPHWAIAGPAVDLPYDYYCLNDYLDETWRRKLEPTTEPFPVHKVAIIFTPLRSPHFGDVPAVEARTEGPGWYQTNYGAFPWVRIEVDGAKFPLDRVALYEGRICLFLTEPGMHRFEISPEPPPAWVWARRLSIALLVSWMAWMISGLWVGETKRSLNTR